MSLTIGTETTLPDPSSLSIRYWIPGGANILANGDVKRDLIGTGAFRIFTVGWANLSGSDLTNVEQAFAEAVAADVAFSGVASISTTVNAGQQPSLTVEAFLSSAGLRYRATMELQETVAL